MRIPRLRVAVLTLASGIVLSSCAYDMYGDPYGYGYGPYGGVSVGYGSGYYGGYGYGYPYGGFGYGGYGYGYDPFGWYGNYYYPGTGIYVYDRHRTRHVWNDDQRRYWQNRSNHWQSRTGSTTTNTGENWSGWDRMRWRDRNTSTTTTGNWRNSGNSGRWQGRSSVTTSGERSRNSDGDRPRRFRERNNSQPQ